jgi:methanogenic corrinoid protein MtbC1
VEAKTGDLADTMGTAPNFSLSSGCAPPVATPWVNLERFVRRGRAHLAEIAPQAAALHALAQAVHAGQREVASDLTRGLLANGAAPLAILNRGLLRAIRKARQCHLPEVLLMVDAFHQGLRELEGGLVSPSSQPPQVVLGTVAGDVHEIGKNLVRIVLQAQGVRVLDLGVDVPAGDFLAACKQHGAQVLGLSAFTSGARRQLRRVVDLARQEGPPGLAVVVGGAAVNPQVAAGLGAQGYARDAMAAARLIKTLLKAGGPAGHE